MASVVKPKLRKDVDNTQAINKIFQKRKQEKYDNLNDAHIDNDIKEILKTMCKGNKYDKDERNDNTKNRKRHENKSINSNKKRHRKRKKNEKQ